MKKIIAFVMLVLMATTLFACETEPDPEPNFYLGESFLSKYQLSIIINPLDDLLAYTTDVIKAKFVGLAFDESNDQWFFEFETIENLRGLNNEKTFLVADNIMDYGYRDPDDRPVSSSHYQQGENYLLLLRRSTSVYSSNEVILSFVCQYLVVPLDDDNKAYLKPGESFLWGVYLGDHIKSEEIVKAFENRKFEEYLLKEIEANPLMIGGDYIKSTDMTEILRKSDYVIEVVIEHIDDSPSSPKDRVICDCKVLSELKGEVDCETPLVVFPQGKYAEGDRYIVAVSPVDSDSFFKMSSLNSVYLIDQKDEIISILSE